MATTVMQKLIWQRYLQKSTLGAWRRNPPPWFVSTTKCEAIQMHSDKSTKCSTAMDDTSDRNQKGIMIEYYYTKMDPNDVERTSLLDSHAVFGALRGNGLIERYNVYRRVDLEE